MPKCGSIIRKYDISCSFRDQTFIGPLLGLQFCPSYERMTRVEESCLVQGPFVCILYFYFNILVYNITELTQSDDDFNRPNRNPNPNPNTTVLNLFV